MLWLLKQTIDQSPDIHKVATEKDFLAAVDKVIKGNLKFNSTATYMQYN